MKYILLTSIKMWRYSVLFLLINNVSAQSLYLTCKTTASPENINVKQFYKESPANLREQFITDVITGGFISVILEKPESWEINLNEQRISSPENNSGPTFTDAKVTKSSIKAVSYSSQIGSYSFDLNRITGKLIYHIYLTDDVTKPWLKKHGGILPTTWKWEQMCTAAVQPKL